METQGNEKVQNANNSDVKNYNNSKGYNNNKGKNFHNKRKFYKNGQDFNPRNKFKKGGKFNKFNAKKRKCDHCGRRNHEKKDCYYYNKMKAAEERSRTLQTVQTHDNNEYFAFMNVAENSLISETGASEKVRFILDSGATDHIVNRLDVFTTVENLAIPLQISIAKKGEKIAATKKGVIKIVTNLGVAGVLENVLYSPDVPYNLLSVRRLQHAGMSIVFGDTGNVTINKGNKLLAFGELQNSLLNVVFQLRKRLCNQITTNNNDTLLNSYKIWHERLGHMNKTKFLEIKRNDLVFDSNKLETINPTNEICEACVYGKQARLPFSSARDRSHVTRPFS